MHASQVTGIVIGAAAFLAALIYIGRQVGRLVLLMAAVAKLPGDVHQLRQATDANTRAIQRLTSRLDHVDGGRRRGGHA